MEAAQTQQRGAALAVSQREVLIPVKTKSEQNLRECWQAKARRTHMQRGQARLFCGLFGAWWKRFGVTPCTIQLTRGSPSEGLDSDNIRAALKHVRDGVADAMGIDDRDPRVTWTYLQQRTKQFLVRVTYLPYTSPE